MVRLITFIGIFLLCTLPCLLFAQREQGFIMDAREVKFKQGEKIRLNGSWQFHYGDFVTARDFDQGSPHTLITVPSAWNGRIWNGSSIEGQGIATYRLTIILNENLEQLALKIPDQSSAYRLYINNKLMTEVGKVGEDKASTTPATHPQIIEFPVNTHQFDIVFHVANFHHKKGGLWESITLGDKESLMEVRSNTIYYDVFLAGAILIIALYHLGLFLLQKKDLSPFYFFLLAFFAVMRVLSTGEMFILQVFPFLNWEWRLSLEHIPFYLLIGLGALFANSLFPNEFKRSVVGVVFVLSTALVVTNLLTPAIFHSYLILPFELVTIVELLYLSYGMFQVLRKRRRHALAYFLGFVIIFVAAINDILYSNNLIDSIYLVPFGIFLFFFSQAFVLSAKSADTFKKVEKLSLSLQDANKNLEEKVTVRTREVENKNEEIKFAYAELKESAVKLEENSVELRKTNSDLEIAKMQIEMAFKKEKNARTTLEDTINQLKAAQTQLVQAEKMVSLGQLTAGIAHEINNPMNFIYAGVEVLRELVQDNDDILKKYSQLDTAEPQTFHSIITEAKAMKEEMDFEVIQEDLQQVVKDITQGAERTIEIIKGLRNFSRTDDTEMTSVDIHSCIDSTLVILKNQYKNRVEIVRNYDIKLPKVICNTGQINQVFMNLLVNAIQAIEGKGSIEISTKMLDHKWAAIQIQDSGKGMPQEIINKIFDPFFTTKPIGEGTGLGLSISHGIIEKHGGKLRVESEVGKGTCFSIELPIENLD